MTRGFLTFCVRLVLCSCSTMTAFSRSMSVHSKSLASPGLRPGVAEKDRAAGGSAPRHWADVVA